MIDEQRTSELLFCARRPTIREVARGRHAGQGRSGFRIPLRRTKDLTQQRKSVEFSSFVRDLVPIERRDLGKLEWSVEFSSFYPSCTFSLLIFWQHFLPVERGPGRDSIPGWRIQKFNALFFANRSAPSSPHGTVCSRAHFEPFPFGFYLYLIINNL